MSLEDLKEADALSVSTTPFSQKGVDSIDHSIRLSTYYFILSGVSWLVLASICALIVGFKLIDPSILGAFEMLSYGRLQAALKSALLMGWVSNAIFAISLWIMARLSAKPIEHGGILLIAGIIWNIGLTIGLLGILIGDMRPFAWFELPSYASGIFLLSYSLIAVWAIVTFRHRNHLFSYVSQWYILGALLWFPWVYVVAQFFLNYFPSRGVMQSIVHAWYQNNVFYLFVASIGLASVYYIIPKVLNVAVRSYHLTALAFWSFALFSSWASFTYLIGSPIPVWLITTSIVSAIALLVPLSIFSINFISTLNGRLSQALRIPYMRFVVFGIGAFLTHLVLKLVLSIRSIDAVAHFTLIHEGLNWHLLYAFFSMVAFGMFYYLLPVLLKEQWKSQILVKIHFGFSAIGMILLLISMYVGGWIQGQQFNQIELSFIEIIIGLKFWLQLQFVALILIFLGNVLFFFNIVSLFCIRFIRSFKNPISSQIEGVVS
tara:strand:- start:6813 stop:8279 length:1467 start_codon:yes stop_codon:yes gene_type:complete